ncbi:MAG: hypothetical protein V1708_01960 [Candidatus Micrarchaeota archaeon]
MKEQPTEFDPILTLREIEPAMIIATLTAFLASEVNKTNPPIAVILILSTLSFSIAGILYYFYKNGDPKWFFIGKKIFAIFSTIGFMLFLVAVLFYFPGTYTYILTLVFIALYIPTIIDTVIAIAKLLENWKSKNSEKDINSE